ncbi:unnamed protein product, partial [Polarella glacialis]
VGSIGHPDHCRPCVFWEVSRDACKKNVDCKYCHFNSGHESQNRVRLSKAMRGRILSVEKQNAARRG